MSFESVIQAIAPLDGSMQAQFVKLHNTQQINASFGQMVSQGINGVNQNLLVSQADMQQLAAGNVQNLHQVMIRLEESHLSFQLLMQVRNRLLEAYQDVMKMQI